MPCRVPHFIPYFSRACQDLKKKIIFLGLAKGKCGKRKWERIEGKTITKIGEPCRALEVPDFWLNKHTKKFSNLDPDPHRETIQMGMPRRGRK